MDYTGAFLLFTVGVNSVMLFRDTMPKALSIIAVAGYVIFSILAWYIGDHGMFLVAILLGGAHALFRVLDVLIGKTIEYNEKCIEDIKGKITANKRVFDYWRRVHKCGN